MKSVATKEMGNVTSHEQWASAGPVYKELSSLGAAPHPFVPAPIVHRLADHPLLALPELVKLSTRLEEHQLQFNLGDLPAHIDRRLVKSNGLSAEETIRRIEECNSWIVLKNVQSDPAYAELLNMCLDEVRTAEEPACPGMHQRECYIFVTSPNAVTPLHMDPEHNILHQIRGAKTLRLWDPREQKNLSDEQLEFFYTTENYRDFQMPKLDDSFSEFKIESGQGLYFPLEAPHWVQNSDAVSISFSTTWRSTFSHRKVSVHQMNAKLRRRGVKPSSYGQNPKRDGLKFATMKALRMGKRLFGR